MTTKTTYKVGDKVRILDAKGICAGFDLDNGKEYPISKIDSDGDIYVIDGANDELLIAENELKYIEKVAEQVTKFKVGDKVRITNAQGSKHRNGDEGIIVSITPIWDVVFYDVDVNGMQQGHYDKDIELVTPKQTKNQRIRTLEQKVEAMQAEIDALKAAQKSKSILSGEGTLIFDGKPIAKVSGISYKTMTPNEQRKAIIDEAKAFVVELSDIIRGAHERETKFGRLNDVGYTFVLKPEFHINDKKRVVTVLMKGANVDRGKIYAKAVAKCAPDDVFNADIGKAIALGRALGLDVERFEKAVQPNEVVVGMVVIHSNDADVYAIEGVHKGNRYDMRHTDGEYFGKFPMMDNIENFYDILDDTEAKY